MNNEHSISDEVLDLAELALSEGKHWMAYNHSLYFVDKDDVYFFDSQNEAVDFANDNISDRDSFCTIRFNSIKDILEKIPYDNQINDEMKKNPDANGLYNPEGNAFTDSLIEHFEQQQSLFNSQLKTHIMNNENLEFLSQQIKFTGFGEEHRAELKEKMQSQQPEFTIFHQAAFGNDSAIASLQFKKSNEQDMYFFNSYNLTVKNGRLRDPLKQSFYINKDNNITLKEAYNLLSGRAVQKELTPKEGEKYKAWVQLDFKETDKYGNYKMKQFHENYGYDLAEALAKHPIKELADPQDKKRLIESLQRGNRQSVTINIQGQDKKVFIEAVPQFKSLNFYDDKQQRLKTDRLYESNTSEQSVKHGEKRKSKTNRR